MIFKGIFIFLTIFSLQNGVKPNLQAPLFEITDIKSIKKFITDHYNSFDSKYRLNETLTVEEKNKITVDLLKETKKLIEKLSEMKPYEKRLEFFLWENLLQRIEPTKNSNTSSLHNFYSGQLRSMYKSIEIYLSRLNLIFEEQRFPGVEKIQNCLHSWAMNFYSMSNDVYPENINNMHQGYSSLVWFISNREMRESNRYDYCKQATSFHQDLYNAYRQFVIKSLEELSVYYYSVLGASVCGDVSGRYPEISGKKKELLDSLKKVIEMTRTTLHNATSYTYLCNPTEDEKSKENTHVELERLVQTVIIAEKDLSTTQSCSHNCNLDSIKDTINKEECDGFLDCQYRTDSYWITELDYSKRRFKYFTGFNDGNIRNLTRYGRRKYGWSGQERKSRVSSTFSWTKMRWCDYCLCSCVMKPSRSSYSTTAISFRDQVSDIYNNKAVIGFKFVKKDHMVHIQILEGQVEPHGEIGYRSWKSLENFDFNETIKQFYVINDDGSQDSLESGLDYGHPDIMNLNDVNAPENHVITGVRFRFAGDSLDAPKLKQGPIELQIRVTPFDFVKGALINVNQSSWISPDKQNLKDELILENPDNPIESSPDSESIITTNKFVKFRASDLMKDAGQSTVPFFDGREIGFHASCPLGGIGLIHRGRPGSGGYLALKIFDFDMSSSFNTIEDLTQSISE